MKKLVLACALITSAYTSIASADTQQSTVGYSIGTGLPYFINAEIGSYSPEGGMYFQVGQSLDVGFTFGWERVVSDNNKHALGLVVGAVGVKASNREIECEKDKDPSIGGAIGCAFASAFSEVFDRRSIYGLGVSYNYSFARAYHERGWKMRVMAGYGEQRASKENEATASIAFRYQF
ncbi:hypothetical protein HG263_18750 [Pseudoalteromonas sp. JBTF-M23]|uniref:Outer membrane protein beta-barrel domain-containing protein n=1 Tax=Pseudoalteromonas caenipelagi TaxID=2726988 RepID=A0A849VGY1_9GAMM|nr:hypothetical protein [Pseudoalteromonas caenipelagi]NOU52546.1 hypothetical protein [Pseudoalteromonas caenipelagi]